MRREPNWFLRIGLIALVLLCSSLYYLYGAWHRVPGAVYSGMRGVNASDYNVNLSWIEQYRRGNFLLKNLYNPEPHRGFLARPVYFLIAFPFGKTSLSNSAIFHILRVGCGFILLLALFPLVRVYEEDRGRSMIVFLLLAFSSGAGLLLKKWMAPPDFGIPEYILFQTLGEPPHFLYSLLLFWTGITAVYMATRGQQNALAIYFLALIFLWWEHPYDVLPFVALALIHIPRLRTRATQLLLLGGTVLFSIGPYLYYNALKKLPVFTAWAAQNVTPTPSVLWLLCAFLPLLALSIPGSMVLWRNPEKRSLLFFLVTWVVLQLSLAFFPVPFQRRFSAGVQFPLALLAAHAVGRIHRTVLKAVIILLCASGNIYATWQQIHELKSGQMPFYLPVSYKNAFAWLAEQPERGAVLSGFITGNFIPAYTGYSVYLGHSHQSPDSANRKERVLNFYRQPDLELLKQNRIQFIFWGMEERGMSTPSLENMFRKVYDRNGIVIFETGAELENPQTAEVMSQSPRRFQKTRR